ncbi:MAG: ORF6N domain-containing protein [Veillonellales bacterium]
MNLQAITSNIPSIKEYQDQRVVTFRDVDAVHQRPEGTAGRNFRENRERFISGEDYFAVKRSELATKFAGCSKEGNPNIEVILLTESGYLLIVKSLTDDKAWQVQRTLINGYFRAKELPTSGQASPVRPLPDILKENMLAGKAFAEVAGIDVTRALIISLNETERQTGSNLSAYKHLLKRVDPEVKKKKERAAYDIDTMKNAILDILKANGSVAHYYINRKLKGRYQATDLHKALDALQADNIITSYESHNGNRRGRTATIWQITAPLAEGGES